jgi:hypothetical protein
VNKDIFIFSCIFLFVCFSTKAQQVTLRGTITDAGTGEKLIGANVIAPELKRGAVSNEYGFYTFGLPKSQAIKVRFSYTGYKSLEVEIKANHDTLVNINLSVLELEEVTVFAERRRIFYPSVNEIQIVAPKNLPYPSLKPEIDILDVIRQMPGVQPGLEGSVGFSVRGGNNDQNLIQMDNVMLYNVGHFANFLSIFDPYAINSITFYKGGFPAKFGGRASSVLDIYLKEGDTKNFKGEANLGLFSAKLALEGPIGNKASFLFSFRRSTVDLFMAGLYVLTKPDSKFFYNFHDLNLKLNYNINSKNHIYLSLYDGIDNLSTDSERSFGMANDVIRRYESQYNNRWGSNSVSFRWNHIFDNNAFNNFTVAYTGFRYILNSHDGIYDNDTVYNSTKYHYAPSIDDLIIKNDVEVLIGQKNKLSAGIHFISHYFRPVSWSQEKIQLYGATITNSMNIVDLHASELFGYAQGQFLFNNDKIIFSPGLRIGRYFLPNNKGFNLIEPRIKFDYEMPRGGTINFSYDKMGQTVHSLNSSGTSLTAVVWIPATVRLRPTISHQVSLGWQKAFLNNEFEIGAGAFYKEMKNLIEFNGNTGFATIEGQWDEGIPAGGFGRAYGLEVQANKSFSKLSLEGNYTFSKSLRRFANINKGNFYPQNFDRPHNLSLSSIYRFNKKLTISALFSYFTGQPFTLGTELYPGYNNYFSRNKESYHVLESPFITHFEDLMVVDNINNFRMPDYHRMDVSMNHKKKLKNNWERTVSISI